MMFFKISIKTLSNICLMYLWFLTEKKGGGGEKCIQKIKLFLVCINNNNNKHGEFFSSNSFEQIYLLLILKVFHTKLCQKSCRSTSCPVFKIIFFTTAFRNSRYIQMNPFFNWFYKFLKKRCRLASSNWFFVYARIADVSRLWNLKQVMKIFVQRQLPYFLPTFQGSFIKYFLKILIWREVTNVRGS